MRERRIASPGGGLAEALVFGATGILGQYLVREAEERGYHAEGTCAGDSRRFRQIDLSEPLAARALVRERRPAVVLLAAAMTSVDGSESQPELAERVNARSAQEIAQACSSIQARLVYFSTDYVFDGQSGPSGEASEPRPINVYGRTKLAGERFVAEMRPSPLIVRTCANFGWNRLRPKENSVTWILNRLRREETVPLFEDQWVSPSFTPEVARLTFDLLEQAHDGLFHIALRDCLTRMEIGNEVCGVFGLPRDLLRPVRLEEARLVAPRPRKSCLAVAKIEGTLKVRMRSFRECLEQMRETE